MAPECTVIVMYTRSVKSGDNRIKI